jgi:hypothetical protein
MIDMPGSTGPDHLPSDLAASNCSNNCFTLTRCTSCRYRTQMCSIGANCKRTVCFFAHNVSELRTPTYPPMPMHLYKMAGTRPPDATADPVGPGMQQQIAEAASGLVQPGTACGPSSSSYNLQQQQFAPEAMQMQQWSQGMVLTAAAPGQGPMGAVAAGVPVTAGTSAYPLQLVHPLSAAKLQGAAGPVPGIHHAYTDPTNAATESIGDSSANSLTTLSPVSGLRARSWDCAMLPTASYQWVPQHCMATSMPTAAAAVSLGISAPQQLLLQPMSPPSQRVICLAPQQQHMHHQLSPQGPRVVPYSGPLQQPQQGLGNAGAAGLLLAGGSGFAQADSMGSAGVMPNPYVGGSVVQGAGGTCYILHNVPGTVPVLQGQDAQQTASDVVHQLASLQLQGEVPGPAGMTTTHLGTSAAPTAIYQQLPVTMVSQGPVGPA